MTNVTNVQSHCCATRFFFQSYRRKVVQGSLLGCFFFLDCQVNFSAIGWTVQRKCDSCIHSSWLLTDHQVTDTWNHHDVLISLVLPRLVRRTVTFVISKIDYHIFSPLDQYRSGNDPHHPRCPRYVINGSALSTSDVMSFAKRIAIQLVTQCFTLSSPSHMAKARCAKKDRGLSCSTSLDCPNVLLSRHFTFSDVACWGYFLGNHRVPVLYLKIFLSCLLGRRVNHNTSCQLWRFHQLVP